MNCIRIPTGRKPNLNYNSKNVTDQNKLYAYVEYGDQYVQPLLITALEARLPPDILVVINDQSKISELPRTAKLLQWCQYEQIDFDHVRLNSSTSLVNSYVIRKALIRKHYLAKTVEYWLAKHPGSVLKKHVKPGVELEVDYAEFLDDALVEAWDLKDSWARSAETGEQEWWILKPGMSDRGQGIRLFSSEDELKEIFEGWDPPDEDEEGDTIGEGGAAANGVPKPEMMEDEISNGIMTSQLRHFIAQPYIQPPLLLPPPHPSAGRKFHIRTYVLAVGALKVYVYKPMLALFAAYDYTDPSYSTPNDNLGRHLTNTCLQDTDEREGSVEAFWSLPSPLPSMPVSTDWRQDVFDQICKSTAEIFEAAARSMSIHFQPLPNAFELFGLDFLVDSEGTAWLLEVNSFPDFKQTGDDLSGLVKELMEGVVDLAIKPFFGLDDGDKGQARDKSKMVEVLDIDLGRR